MAEEYIIYGKNLHVFGGIEPSNVLGIELERIPNSDFTGEDIRLTVKAPKDTVVDGQVLCSVKGYVVRRKTDGYPVDEFDGDLVTDRTCVPGETYTFYDTFSYPLYSSDVFTTTYYYAVFPYSTQGVYNRNKANRAVCYPYDAEFKDYIFGYDLDTNDPDPSTRVTYPSGVDNSGYNPLRLGPDGTGCTAEYMSQLAPEYDSNVNGREGWFKIRAGEKFMPRPCMLSYDCDWSSGKSYYLSTSDYKRKYGSTESSDINNADYEGNAMMQWPKIYTYREEVDGIYKFRCSNKPHGTGWNCWCNIVGKYETDHFYTSIYHAMKTSNGMLRSLSSNSAICNPSYSLSAAIYHMTTHEANSYWKLGYSSWNVECLADRLLIQDLLVMMAGTTDTTSVYGYGIAVTGSSYATGSVNNNAGGMFYTNSISGSTTVGHRLFGMENLWGNVGRMCAGWIIDDGIQKIKITRGTSDGSMEEEFNATGSGYLTLEGADIKPYNPATSVDASCYIREMKTTPFGRIPMAKLAKSEGSGSGTTYECDYFKATVDGLCTGYFGGIASTGSKASYYGAFYSVLVSTTGTIGSTSTGLSCKPIKEV